VAIVGVNFKTGLILFIIVLVVQQLEGNVLSPLLQSNAMNLHPVIVLLVVSAAVLSTESVGAFLASADYCGYCSGIPPTGVNSGISGQRYPLLPTHKEARMRDEDNKLHRMGQRKDPHSAVEIQQPKESGRKD